MKKLFLFLTATLFSIGTWAETETINTTGSNTAYDGTCVSVAGTYIAGSTSGGYSKFRTNQSSNTLPIVVKSGYKITGFSIQAYSNNSTTGVTIPITSITYDGGSNLLAESIVLPISSSKPSSPQYTNSTNEATSNITLTFDNSNVITDKDAEGYSGGKNNQIMAIIILTYELDCTAADATFEAENDAIEIAKDASSASTTITFTKGDNTNDATFVVTKGGTATVNASYSAGTFTATAAGTYKVTATQENDGTHCEVVKEVTITVTDANGPDCSAGLLFKMEALKVCTCSIASNTDYPITDGENYSVEGGSLMLHNVNSSQKVLMTKNQSSLIQWNWNTGDVSFNITLDCELAAGDTIKYTTNQSGQNVFLNTTKGTKAKSGECDTILSTNLYYVIKKNDILEGQSSFSMWRSGSSTYMRTIEVVRPQPDCAASEPGDISKGTLTSGILTLEAEGSAVTGDTWYWQTSEDGTDDTYDGSSFDVTAAGTYYIRSYNTDDECWSAAKSFEVTATDLVANYTVVYKDGEKELDSETVAVSGHPEGIDDPTKEFYTFAGWEYNSSAVVPTEFVGEEGQTYDFMAVWTAQYASTADFAAIVNAGTTASNPIGDFSASHNMKITEITSESKWETATDKSGFIGFKLKDAGAVVKFLVQSGKYVTITLGSVGDNATLSKGGVESTVAKKKGDNEETIIDTFQPKADMIVSLTTTTNQTVTLKKIAITDADPTALDNTDASVKAVKVLRDGQIFIEKNGHVYNVFGACIK